jgi:hypothetical protein
MKTAMQELLSEMSHPNWDKLSFDARYQMFDMLLELEKDQIKMAKMDFKQWLEDRESQSRTIGGEE